MKLKKRTKLKIMYLKKIDPILSSESIREDSMDIPDCFGEFNISEKLCTNYCAVSIKCSAEPIQDIKNDILEKLLNFDSSHLKPQ